MKQEKYIGGQTGGIPESIFHPGLIDFIILGLSGQKLQCTTVPNLIDIKDMEHPKYHFFAYIEDQQWISCSVRNTDAQEQKKKHPDIYPTRLLRRSISYFEQYGYPIEGIKANWDSTSSLLENYLMYWENLSNLGNSAFTEEDYKNAARNTKTGNIARRLGFPIVDTPHHSRRNGGEVITVIFKKADTYK